jgi:bifunctional non-homologous end joining protein LigD
MKQNFTNLDKIYFPKSKITKGEILEYYKKIAPTILPYLKDRPESLNRHPNGITKPNFFQKNFTYPTPPYIKTYKRLSESTGEKINYIVCNNTETLLYMANLGCIEINPWSSRISKVDYPDWMVIDLDPPKTKNYNLGELIKVTLEVKKVLDMSCEKSYVKTSGKRGIHIFIPLGGRYNYDKIRDFSHLLVQIVNRKLPDITSIERSPAKRKGKIYLDFLQNSMGQTLASPYSVRPQEGATVSTPLKWSEVKSGLNPAKFTIHTTFPRLKKYGDLWQGILKDKVDLNKAIKCLEKELSKNPTK